MEQAVARPAQRKQPGAIRVRQRQAPPQPGDLVGGVALALGQRDSSHYRDGLDKMAEEPVELAQAVADNLGAVSPGNRTRRAGGEGEALAQEMRAPLQRGMRAGELALRAQQQSFRSWAQVWPRASVRSA